MIMYLMRLESITFELYMTGYDVILLLLKIKQEVRPYGLIMINGQGGEHPWSQWNNVEVYIHII